VNATASPSRPGPPFAGVFAPICTPFGRTEAIDYVALRYNLARYAASGIRGHLALGSNGENRSLTERERIRVVDEVARGRGHGQVVMAGAAYDAERDTKRFLMAAAAVGADFGLVLPPGYFRKQMTDDVLFGYYTRLADTARMPLLLYNAPGFCGVTLSVELVARLAQHPNIVGMKDSASSGIEHFLALQSESFHVLAGSADFLFPAMMGGSAGGTVSLANAFPAVALRLFEYGRARDAVHGLPYQDWVVRVNRAISGTYGVPGVKAAMTLAGFRGGIPRRPLLPLEPAQVGSLRDFLSAEGLLP
jgi:4-hydroxy-2-oxoglutarate aldolase